VEEVNKHANQVLKSTIIPPPIDRFPGNPVPGKHPKNPSPISQIIYYDRLPAEPNYPKKSGITEPIIQTLLRKMSGERGQLRHYNAPMFFLVSTP
jgi:hypothetical protein